MFAQREKRDVLRRRGAITVFMAISMVVVIGMAALAIDIAALYSAQAELQRTADAAALAAAGQLVSSDVSGFEEAAIEAANDVAERNSVMRRAAGLDSASDVEFGKAVLDAATGRFMFQVGAAAPDAVRVTVRRAEGSQGGPIALLFSRMLGWESRNLEARAAAMLVPRDIALVLDISNSMCWDSQLRYWNRQDGGYSNLRDVWAALNGPEPAQPYAPGHPEATQYAGDTGPSIGVMSSWGDQLIPNVYSPSSDPGVWHIRKTYSQTLAAITTSLSSRGYTSDERSILMGGTRDGSSGTSLAHWYNRCGVMLGLASWQRNFLDRLSVVSRELDLEKLYRLGPGQQLRGRRFRVPLSLRAQDVYGLPARKPTGAPRHEHPLGDAGAAAPRTQGRGPVYD
jgi:Flp pilus assembly protein TadG